MQVGNINNTNPQFKAKFLDTPAIKQVAEWARDNGRYKELNNARKQIDFSAVKLRIHMDLATNIEGYPIAIFRRYFPRIINPVYEKDYIISKPIVYTGKNKTVSAAEYGFNKILQMGHYVTRNKMFKDIVRSTPLEVV